MPTPCSRRVSGGRRDAAEKGWQAARNATKALLMEINGDDIPRRPTSRREYELWSTIAAARGGNRATNCLNCPSNYAARRSTAAST